MRVFKWAGVLVGSLLLETTVLQRIQLWNVGPDLVLVAVLLFALVRGAMPGAAMGFYFGLVEDLLAGRYIGLNALGKALTGYLVGLGESRLYKNNPLVPMVGVFTGTIAFELCYLILGLLGGMRLELTGYIRIALPVAVYNTLVAFLSYPLFARSVAGTQVNTPRSLRSVRWWR